MKTSQKQTIRLEIVVISQIQPIISRKFAVRTCLKFSPKSTQVQKMLLANVSKLESSCLKISPCIRQSILSYLPRFKWLIKGDKRIFPISTLKCKLISEAECFLAKFLNISIFSFFLSGLNTIGNSLELHVGHCS